MGEVRTQKPLVLIAEHTEMNSSIMQAMLGAEFDTVLVQDGVQAVKLLEDMHDRISMVLLDATMPRMTGIEVLEIMNEKGWIDEMPVMMMPGDDSSEVVDRAYELGAIEYLSHVMNRRHLRKRVNNVLQIFEKRKQALQLVAKENAKLAEERYRLLNMDDLTGCLNFAGFKEKARWLMLRNPDLQYELWYCDIKQFKLINDAFGYANGDRLLRGWARMISEQLDENEIVGRVNADNMMVLAYTRTGEPVGTRFMQACERIKGYLNEPGITYDIEIAGGVYLVKPEDMKNPDVNLMMDMANVAQKSVKNHMGSSFALYTDAMWTNKLRESKISRHLESAMARGEIAVWLQPQYNYSTGELVGAEALCRWNHSMMGFISPGEFIPILERTGQIAKLDRYVWEQTCRCVRKWMDDDPTYNLALSVNVSRMDIREVGFLNYMKYLIEKYEIPPALLRLEITESAYMDEAEQLIDIVKRLQDMGFVVEMDDFGSGYSSLNMLKEVPVDVLKLDMKFLSEKGDESRGGSILSAIIRLAHTLEIPVIAEGVETFEQANFLKNLGCKIMQGYCFSKPLPLEEFEKLIDGQRVGDIPHSFNGPGLKNLNEVMDSKSNSSFVFDTCIGGAMLIEYDGIHVDAVMVNDAFFEAVGVSRERFDTVRRDLLSVMDNYTGNRLRQILNAAIANGTANDIGHKMANGRYLSVKYRKVSQGAHSHVLFALIEDITTSYEVQQKLDEVTHELYSHMDLMPGGFFRYDADGEQRFTFVSTSMLDMLGYELEEFLIKFNGCFPDMVYEEDRERVMRELDDEIAEGVDTRCEYRIECADGSLKWVYDVGRLITDDTGKRWYYVVITDMDNKKEELLEQTWQKSMYQTLAELPGMITYDYNPKSDELTVRVANKNGQLETIQTSHIVGNLEDQHWLAPESARDFVNEMRKALNMPMNGTVEFKGRFNGQQNYRWYRAYFTSVADENGKVYRIAGRADDIERDKRQIMDWKNQAQKDVMTGLLNHDSSLQYIEGLLREGNGGIMFLVDVDNFKQINDTYGHIRGDEILIQVSNTLREVFRKGDVVGRFGGDEFIMFIPGEQGIKLASSKADEIIRKINEIEIDDGIYTKCSIGVAVANNVDMSSVELFAQADSALYDSKRKGKGIYTIFEPLLIDAEQYNQ